MTRLAGARNGRPQARPPDRKSRDQPVDIVADQAFQHLVRTGSASVAAGWVVVRPTAYIPAALAAWIPTVASSKTTDRAGRAPALAAAIRKTWGSGLPRVRSSSEAIAANRPWRPQSLIEQLEVCQRAARADRQLHPPFRERIEQRTHAVEQPDLPPGDIAIALLLQIRVVPHIIVS